MIHREQYRDWHLTAYLRQGDRGLVPWRAVARRNHGSKLATIKVVDGRSMIEAVQAVKRVCDEMEAAHAG